MMIQHALEPSLRTLAQKKTKRNPKRGKNNCLPNDFPPYAVPDLASLTGFLGANPFPMPALTIGSVFRDALGLLNSNEPAERAFDDLPRGILTDAHFASSNLTENGSVSMAAFRMSSCATGRSAAESRGTGSMGGREKQSICKF
jgi:hypothetical protein